MRRIKILYHHRIGSKDGQAVHIESLITALKTAGHEVCVVSPAGFTATDFGGQSRWLTQLRRGLPRAAFEVLELAYNVPALFRLGRARRRFRPDLIYERYNLFMIAGVLLARLCHIPLFLEVNSPLARERSAFGGLGFRRLAEWLERRTWRAAAFVLPVSHVLAEAICRAGVQAERVVVIPNAIDDAMFPCAASEEAKQALGLRGKLVLGFVGFVREWHGLERVIDLLSDPRCRANLHLLVVGDGPALPALKLCTQQLGLSGRVTFTGVVNREDIARHVAAFDIALQPRAVEYASPLKVFEYMAAGKAIVAPAQANIMEILTDGHDARLFDPANDGTFREAVFELAGDSRLRESLGAGARRTVLDRGYTWADNARRIVALHDRLKDDQSAKVR